MENLEPPTPEGNSPAVVPTFEELAADPEIGRLLDFEPVPRSHAKANGWTPDMQRMFIAWLAYYGSPTNACDELGKARSGIDKVYKSDGAEEFRASWEGAIALAEKRRIAAIASRRGGAGAMRAPTMSRALPQGTEDPDPESGISEDQKWDLIHHVGVKFMRKVAAERSARLAGKIVAADFYLRQITALEVMLDLLSVRLGFDAREVLSELRRGGHHLNQIASTSFSDWMDASRRLWWSQEGAPERPPHPDVRFLERRRSDEGDYATTVDQHTYGKTSPPARGYTQDEWALLSFDDQRAARQRQFDQEALAQIEWERRAYEEWEARRVRER